MWLRDWAISITVLHCEPPVKYSPEHDDKRLKSIWRCRLMVSQLVYTQFSPRLGQNQSSTLCAATMNNIEGSIGVMTNEITMPYH